METNDKTTSAKIFQAVVVLVTVYCFIAGFFELPPANLLIRYYCQLFSTDKYPVLLISLVLLLICIIALGLIKKAIDYIRRP